ncbi:M15 family metallopeptidase [Paenibacillus sp. GCM10023252]|uniref:M15 family metallopeptidase n=1 Tax=Paenibacillus sp. GCM10023252 TaxID=3252649 RepID=UPI00361DFFC1
MNSTLIPSHSPRRQLTQKHIRRRRTLVLLLLVISLLGLIAVTWLKQELELRDVPPVMGMHPVVAAKQLELERATRKLGITILVTDSFRSKEEQDALHRQGRSESGRIVTKAKGGQSYHNFGLAIDFALRTKQGKVIWDMEYDGNKNGKSDWMEVVAVAKGLGFTWGGDWKSFRDYPHLQMDFGYSIRDLQRGKRPPTVLE